jgi:hypothetical protein
MALLNRKIEELFASKHSPYTSTLWSDVVLSTYPLGLAVGKESRSDGVGVVGKRCAVCDFIVKRGGKDSNQAYSEVRDVDEVGGTSDASV